MEVGRCVCPCVCVCQAFRVLEAKRLVRSGPATHHSTRRNAGTMMVMVRGRHVTHGTCHVLAREPLQIKLRTATGQTKRHEQSQTFRPPGSMTQLKILLGFSRQGCKRARARDGNCFHLGILPISGNFELATRNLVHWCSLTSAI